MNDEVEESKRIKDKKWYWSVTVDISDSTNGPELNISPQPSLSL